MSSSASDQAKEKAEEAKQQAGEAKDTFFKKLEDDGVYESPTPSPSMQ